MIAPQSNPSDAEPRFDRALGPVEGTSIVIGTVIGSGIFITPAKIAASAGQFGFGTILLVWIVCGILSLSGALAYAELAAMFPRSGGQYVYLREAYGDLWAFLYGWMEFWVARAGSIAALAVAFALYASDFRRGLLGLGPGEVESGDWGIRWTAFLAVFVLTGINYLGVRLGGVVQVLFTGTKILALVGLVACAFGLPGGSSQNWLPLWTDGGMQNGLDWGIVLSACGAAMISSLWAYDGWANGAVVAEEMKDPQRNVPRSLIIGTLTLTVIYILANLAYHYLMPMSQVAGSQKVIVTAASKLFGDGRVALALAAGVVMISTFGAANGTLLTGPRIFHAMARDRLFFHQMAFLHPRFRTPYWSILFQGLWACLLILVPFNEFINPLLGWEKDLALFDQLITFVIFASWVFYGTSVAAVMVLRRRRPDLPRPYRAWGYPVLPFLFVLTSIGFVANTIRTQPKEALAGVLIVLFGIPAFFWWKSRNPAEPVDRPHPDA